MKKSIFPYVVIASLALAALACSININVPSVKTGELVVMDINEPAPSGYDSTRLTLEMGAGKLDITPGATSLIQGTVSYNVSEWKPEIVRSENAVRIEQGEIKNVKFPSDEIVNDWVLTLGTTPIDLTINAGAYKGTLELGGLSLVNLSINDGASQAEIRFSEPNLVEMSRLHYKTGASDVKLIGLANANADSVSFDSGAGAYTLDFTGELKRDLRVDVNSGVSTIKIIVPDGVPCRVTISGGLNNVSPTGTWSISQNIYEKGGTGQRIDISLDMGLGNLELISR
jgi:hypothetical protein